jgi:catechol 2,3-dioxygenase-like lactoylglutathione lyase family enzyme
MIHHLSLGTNEAERARRFYAPVLGMLGLTLLADKGGSLDYGVNRFLFSLEKPTNGKPASAGNGVTSPSRLLTSDGRPVPPSRGGDLLGSAGNLNLSRRGEGTEGVENAHGSSRPMPRSQAPAKK